ncbi:uncharacterized protein LOC125843145 [Solanum stenotomum]|uniref:uncharacterized protein LOC125843145 n=1 Tax=Solanum stenotomum TaxID=172797 RepID=UPI0020D1F03D|nr:uncharacterized protein LOC125843145 [Solanum stenotomum]
MGFAEELKLSIGIEGVEKFKNIIFGPYLNIPNCNYQGQITKCLLLLELEQDNIDELHIRHASGNILHFTIKEFAIITGLKCTGDVNEFKYPDSRHSRLIQRYFPDSQNILGDANILIHHFYMVEDGRYQQYPWGQIAFSKLMKSLRQEFTKEKKMYRLAGSSSQAASVAPSSSRSTPQLGATVVPMARVQKLKAQMAKLLHHIQPWMQKSIAESEARMERMMEGMMDCKVLTFLRRSRRISTTPPQKRRKNAHPAKPDVIDVNQPEQSAVQSNKNSPIPVSNVNVPDVHVPSLDPKEPTDRSWIKHVKKYRKKYNIFGISTSPTMPEFNQEDDVVRPPTTNQLFDKRSSPIAMDVLDNDRFEVDVVEDQEQNLIPEPKIVEDVDTCKEKEGRKDVSDLPHTTEVHDEEDVPIGGSKTFHQVMLDEHDVDKVQDNVIKSDKSGSTNSNLVSVDTQEAVDTLNGIHSPMDAQPQQIVTPQQRTDTHNLRSGNLLPMDTNVNETAVHEVSKIIVQILRLSSKIFRSPYVTIFGSSDKGKEKVDSELHIRPNHPFEGCVIIFQPPSVFLDQYHQWLSKGLLKTHDKK